MESGIVRHLMLARLRPGTTPEAYAAAMVKFREMAVKMEGLVGFEHGINNSPQENRHGFVHAVMMTFASAAARDAYLSHPEHEQFLDWVRQLELLEDILVFDFSPTG